MNWSFSSIWASSPEGFPPDCSSLRAITLAMMELNSGVRSAACASIIFRDGDDLDLQSRNKKPLLRYFPELREPLQRALVEWDWRMQDGIDTPQVPSSYAAAIQRMLERDNRALASRLSSSG